MSIVANPVRTGMVVVRYQNHRLIKGITQDFYPEKAEFHVQEGGGPGQPSVKVRISEVKAVFFVKTFEGDRKHHPPANLQNAQGQGRRVEVTFKDGEVLRGFTVGYNPAKQGFFVLPADSEGNNQRAFIVNAAVKKVAWP